LVGLKLSPTDRACIRTKQLTKGSEAPRGRRHRSRPVVPAASDRTKLFVCSILELAIEVSKEVKKARYYEYTLIHCYKVMLWVSFMHNHFFIKEGKHHGEATIEAVRLIADHVKLNDCQLHPNSIKEVPKQLPVNNNKKTRYELISKAIKEVDADLRAVSFTLDPKERKGIKKKQFLLCLRLTFVLRKFSHLHDLDFMVNLYLASRSFLGIATDKMKFPMIMHFVFKVWRSNLDALNVDLHDFFVQLYNLILECWGPSDHDEVLVDALKTLLWEGKQQDMLRVAAFIKHLATFALSFGSGEAITLIRVLCSHNSISTGTLSSVLWELSLLEKHYNISVSSMASNILTYRDLSIERELLKPASKALPLNLKRKRHGKEFVV
ncbi:hypothetical protein ACJX0J_040074, partial [Zea mays]